MIKKYREKFNSEFTPQKYEAMLEDVASDFNYRPTFRIAETPFFISNELRSKILEGCRDVIALIKQDNFKLLTQRSLELNHNIPNEDEHTTFLAIDFGICEENGETVPKLIEVQGFPSLFNFQSHLYDKFVRQYPFLSELTPFIKNVSAESYSKILQEALLNGHSPEHVILLEVEPEKQNTKIDFYYCERDLGIPTVCVTELVQRGKQLFYTDKHGREIRVERIYNRVIFDELDLRTDLNLRFNFDDQLDVEWAGHPNWFFRISKYILPMLSGKYFIETTLLSDLKEIPDDLENYVLKPLFSFSGTGVIFHVKREDIESVTQKDLYILQKKVHYKPIVESPDGKVKAEVRILCIWQKGHSEPTLLCNLVRLSRGEMIGVKYNKDKDWVGGTLGLFEPKP